MQNAYFPMIFDLGKQGPDVRPDEPTALAFLTEQDWQLLAGKASLATFEKDEVILEKGQLPDAIYIIEIGQVRIQRESGDTIARRGPGSVFGEVSFLEGKGASATVVADETVEVSAISRADVEALLESMPEFATRFYRTLAVTLAYRLRQAVERLKELS
ncbi:MAG: cyclic nucleotide-binding domain-containing protein [Candidatus Promineifilaceae bacterium]